MNRDLLKPINREFLIPAASMWAGWCTDNDSVLPDLAALSGFLLDVQHQMALDRDCTSCAHQPPSEPLLPQSGTDTRSTTLSPQVGAQGNQSEMEK